MVWCGTTNAPHAQDVITPNSIAAIETPVLTVIV
eukprot:CAMPEP_0113320696 /NCGR_PEP_ID=MMETSP0010_2-20120614/14430_1 /TAXON_ID=216773 ORGANISM="Corethron hystrix, Strain 308" /NCGR_SAMPLE_ID=MMETSP0010_2 /ASSEMBLY_ACC=CAM_ASM_000155 /LENGTH=33 /DNA_ID=CAMNT_0000178587 /DNA_START=307 /DNA_END=405 /DNA_ORIENTATION=+ /assembly_acc=CAM_ASM_000155